MVEERLGVDIGGVVITHDKIGDDYQFLPGVVEVLRRLNEERFPGKVHMVSQMEPDMEDRVRWWLWQKGFYEKTGIRCNDHDNRVEFCRSMAEKLPICQRLGITHFIDDRLEIHSYLYGVVPNLYHFQGREEEDGQYLDVIPHVKFMASWWQIQQEFFPHG